MDFIKKAESISPHLEEAVRYLLNWKLGKISKKQTPSSMIIPWTDEKGTKYYLQGTTSSNNHAIDKALSKNLLELGIKFRDNQITYEEFKSKVDSITKTSIVLPTFFIHLWKPAEYPILDVKVWRVYLWNQGKAVSKNSKPLSWSHYEQYTNFFNDLITKTGLEWRDVDKGLWSIGDDIL